MVGLSGSSCRLAVLLFALARTIILASSRLADQPHNVANFDGTEIEGQNQPNDIFETAIMNYQDWVTYLARDRSSRSDGTR